MTGKDRLTDLLLAWEDLREREQEASPEELCRDCPELLDALVAEIAALHRFSWVKKISPNSQHALHGNEQKTTDSWKPTPPDRPEAESTGLPERIGRYLVVKVLGKGGFGQVYLAHDDELHRSVAIKVPHRDRVSRPEDIESYLAEARVLASLDHSNIVPVYDVGRTGDGLCYVVSKYIEGSDLATKIKESRLAHPVSVKLAATIAEALHYAHRHKLVHRDVKPANILIDSESKPFVADFGLALKEEDFGRGAGFAGTPSYMSPEQARGEGHRVDGRSDIFSLGVVFYELLTGRRPFGGESLSELLEQIKKVEARPPRQVDDTIPKELERICLKAISKRASERYTTAIDMAEDLRQFLPQALEQGKPAPTPTPALPVTPSSDLRPVKIVPKGLRSFDAQDADFFLELLPGPRDRDGLPDSLRFWKTRIEEMDPDNSFSVGLIYGPSGCGKSSLVKAGLLPRLSGSVLPIYVEATGEETEVRLVKGLRKHCPDLPPYPGLIETLTALRRDHVLPPGKKVLLVLDQFEQWLHARQEEETTELVQALRQCDGQHLQCIVMVRDDFWLAVSRFVRDLEVDLVPGRNIALVDLFDLHHARKVLVAFGRAFGKLPEQANDISKEQNEFLTQAVSGLTQEGKVICVRLALFAEMMKGKSWTQATFKEVGGAEGVGVTFLEETFSSPSANPRHRLHQKAARSVLKALLPDSGANIKGHMRSQAELLAASGYGSRPKDFDDLFRILDSEIRLITPTDPEGKEGAEDSLSQLNPGQRYYQLTHDYLVPSLRDWLTRKQKETRRGRAELLLADRAAVWNARPETRQLPSLLQWLHIRWLTAKRNWTPPQRKMMRKASRYHVVRGLMVGAIIMVVAVASWEGFGRLEGRRLANSIVVANMTNAPGLVKEMAWCRQWVNPLLQEAYAQAERDKDRSKQLKASIALLPGDPGQVEYLVNRLLEAEAQELIVIREALLPHHTEISEDLWSIVQDPKADLNRRFRAACGLAGFTPDDPRWHLVSDDVADRLVNQNAFVLGKWAEALQPVGKFLLPPLASFCGDEKRNPSARSASASLYNTFAEGQPDGFARLEKVLAEPGKSGPQWDKANLGLVKRQANIGASLAAMGHGDKVWPLLKHSPDPTLRSYLIDRLASGGVDPKVLQSRFEQEQDLSIKRALLLSLGEFGQDRLPVVEQKQFRPWLARIYREDQDAGIHSAAEWVLWRWEAEATLNEIDKELATGKVEGKRGWYINGQGQTMMLVLQPPDWFWMGDEENRHKQRINRSFAIAAKEVTVEQFRVFQTNYQANREYAPSDDCPVMAVSWYEAAAYCNWLSEKEGLPREECCYEASDKMPLLILSLVGKAAAPTNPWHAGWVATTAIHDIVRENDHGMKMAANYLRRKGYRLPTEAEWEYACRAGAATGFSFGESDDLVGKYAWQSGNSYEKSNRVGSLRPNDYGLFDMHGNACEWCQDRFTGKKQEEDTEDMSSTKTSRVIRGGAFSTSAPAARFGYRDQYMPTIRTENVGFRPARTFLP